MKINLDLQEPCNSCDATGTIRKAHFKGQPTGLLKPVKKGFKPKKNKLKHYTYESVICDNCRGKGVLITAFGQEVLDFVKQHTNNSMKPLYSAQGALATAVAMRMRAPFAINPNLKDFN